MLTNAGRPVVAAPHGTIVQQPVGCHVGPGYTRSASSAESFGLAKLAVIQKTGHSF